ncbi:MAG: Zn-ribbon domain-containing OB-fold protein [Chloroflexi bacterium]|nr:Zn-ribbon domain-containing OB-fold protein [Chloroflexota bacterium]
MTFANYWRTRKQRLNLLGESCPQCGAILFPPRDVCPKCSGPAKTPKPLSGRGTVYSFSTLYSAPQGFTQYAPYVVAVIKLAEGPLVTAQLTDVSPAEVQIGMPVEMVTRKVYEEGEAGLIHYSFKFRPVLQTAAQIA